MELSVYPTDFGFFKDQTNKRIYSETALSPFDFSYLAQ